MTVRTLLLFVAFCLTGVPLGAQKSPATSHDLTAQPLMDLNSNIRIKKVMGEIGTFALGEFSAGFKSNPHHHTYEQINIGLSGAFTLPVGGTAHTVAPLRGVVIPPDVEHNNDVPATANPVLIEFQSTRRVDFPPEREKVSLPVGPIALPVPAGRQVVFDFSAASTGWDTLANGVRLKASVGTVTAIAVWEIPSAARESFELRRQLPGAEQFAYLVAGAIEGGAGTERFAMTPGVLLVGSPGGPPLRATANGAERSVLLVFEASR